MNKILTSAACALLLASTAAQSAIIVDFNYPTGSSIGLGTLTLAFSVNGDGSVVTLNASTTTVGSATAVNAWDGNVGSVANPAAFGKSFTLTSSTYSPNVANPSLRLVTNDTGVLGIAGDVATRVDGGAVANPESLIWTLSDSNSLALNMTSWSFGNSLSNSAIRLMDSDTNVDFLNLGTTAATLSLVGSGLTLSNSQALTFTIPTGSTNPGAGIAGFAFDVVAVPEPSLTALLGFGLIAFGFSRRRLPVQICRVNVL